MGAGIEFIWRHVQHETSATHWERFYLAFGSISLELKRENSRMMLSIRGIPQPLSVADLKSHICWTEKNGSESDDLRDQVIGGTAVSCLPPLSVHFFCRKAVATQWGPSATKTDTKASLWPPDSKELLPTATQARLRRSFSPSQTKMLQLRSTSWLQAHGRPLGQDPHEGARDCCSQTVPW